MLAARSSDAADHVAPPRPSGWAPHWPLSVIFLGIPLWWALGLMTAVPMVMAVVMARDLFRRRDRLVLPQGFLLWALFLAWVGLGVLVLWADAPDAVPGGGPSRLLVFALRAGWYFAATMTLLWVMSRTEEELPTRWVFELLAFLFVVTTAGGVLGLLAPTLEFRSLVELVLPSGLRNNALVSSLVHPAAAEIQSILEKPGPRPQAPFAFANTWGSVMALSIPFFVVAWMLWGRTWQRVAAPAVLLAAAFPTVYSLNRGLWVCLAMGFAGLLLLQLARRRMVTFFGTIAAILVLGVVASASPLGDIYEQRLTNQHSNERRSVLLSKTVENAAQGSPVVGFGSTRDVRGNFDSIAGGATADCSACGVPALGTQGHLWLVIFSQGLLGAGLFLSFFGWFLLSCWRCRTTTETVCAFVLAFFAFQLFVYDTLDLPFVVVMIAIALVARERLAGGLVDASRRRATDAWRRLREVGPFVALLAVGGAVLGGAWSLTRQAAYTASVSVLLSPAPIELDTATTDPYVERSQRPTNFTVDTEAGLVVSRQTLRRVASGPGADVADLGRSITVTAPPQTRILTISTRATSPGEAEGMARDVTRVYLDRRHEQLVERRREALVETERQVGVLVRGASFAGGVETDRSPVARQTQDLLEQLQTKISALTVTPVDAGEVVDSSPAREVSRQPEVPVTSGAALGLALGALMAVCRPRWAPRLRLRPRWRPGGRRVPATGGPAVGGGDPSGAR